MLAADEKVAWLADIDFVNITSARLEFGVRTRTRIRTDEEISRTASKRQLMCGCPLAAG